MPCLTWPEKRLTPLDRALQSPPISYGAVDKVPFFCIIEGIMSSLKGGDYSEAEDVDALFVSVVLVSTRNGLCMRVLA